MAPPDRPKPTPPRLPPTKELGGRQGEPPPLRRPVPPVPGKAPAQPQDEPAPVVDRILIPHDEPPAMPEPRARQPSHRDFDDEEPNTQAGAVEGRVNRRIDRLEDKFERRFDDVELAIKKSAASASSDTVKTIVAGVVAVVTAVAGSRLVAPEAKENKTEVIKSQAEVESELCKKLSSQQERDFCLTGVLTRLIEPAKR